LYAGGFVASLGLVGYVQTQRIKSYQAENAKLKAKRAQDKARIAELEKKLKEQQAQCPVCAKVAHALAAPGK
jgi:cell division protein FtsB